MDNVIQIKNSLIERIKSSNNLKFLNALQILFDSAEEELFQLSEIQKENIDKGRADIENGRFQSNEQMFREMKSWLKKK